ncbi:hypothetical protein [Rhizobium giardinii]
MTDSRVLILDEPTAKSR